MARFDIYRNIGPNSTDVPYVIDVQCDLLRELETRVVIPCRRRGQLQSAQIPPQLAPVIEIEGVPCVLETHYLAAVPVRLLKAKVASLAADQAKITAALDFLYQGF